ncbi:MAG TPA: beta-ketoacyl-[acyl-carrier-protein] synthase family protein [Acidobacteriota bacterium]|nr:beta-ketoacyl-[acyl-carrier-protein] synthase family protein [Acidobacteriota bacterium]
MPQHRVVITGLGVICSLGRNSAEFWTSLSQGACGIFPLELVDRSRLRFQNAAEVRGYRAEDFFTEDRIAIYDRFTQLGMIASQEAVSSSGVDWTPELSEHTGIVTGTATGGQTTEDAAFADLYLRNKTRFNPLSITRVMANALASHISMEYGIKGPAFTLSTACSSANHAIGQAFWMVRDGLVDIAVTGGSEAPFSLGNLKAWEAMRVVSPETCRPFSKNRNGLILGEGAGILILENRDQALARGAVMFGEIVGFGMSSDAHHITQPSAEGAARAMKVSLADAGLQPEAIGYVNAHGTATPANDAMETTAIRSVFGKHADALAVSSTKSMHGHALGAAGALEAIATVLALRNGILPPTANFTEPDPACDLDVIPNAPRRVTCEYALSNSFAFGGLNAVLAFRRAVA